MENRVQMQRSPQGGILTSSKSKDFSTLNTNISYLGDNNKSDISTTNKNKSELLYLISKVLGSFSGEFNHTIQSLHEELDKNRTLGNIIGWDGKMRVSTVCDIDKLYPKLPANQLNLLINPVVSKKNNPNSIENLHSDSLLRSVSGVYYPHDENSRDNYTLLSQQIVALLSDLRSCNKRKTNLIDKKKYLEKKLINLQIDARSYSKTAMDSLLTLSKKDDTDNATDNNNDSDNKENNIDDDESVQIISKIDYVNSRKDVPAVLSEIGIQKELSLIVVDIDNANNSYQQLSDTLQDLLSKLALTGCLQNGLTRGNIDCGVDFLTARSLGMIRRNNNSVCSMGRAMVPSVLATSKRLATRYKKLWTIGGHLGNPAYCCVFDRKGQFVLSGADDYLIKIWDISKGQLVRTCRGHLAYITYIAINPDNSLFASSCILGTIRIWRLTDGKCVQVLKHQAAVNWMKFDEYTSSLASASDDGICLVWDISKLVSEEDAFVPVFDILYAEKNSIKEKNQQVLKSSSSDPMDGSKIAINGESSENNNKDQIDLSEEVALTTRTGLFKWSRENHTDRSLRNQDFVSIDLLPFHHIQDKSLYSTAASLFHKVRCLDISPAAGIVVTGCEDGIARVWRFNDEVDPTFGNRVTKTLSLIESAKKDINHQNFKILKLMTKHLLDRLEGHVSPITDIHVSKYGDRILTASSDDGNVRIWSFTKSYLKNTHIVLRLYEEEEESVQPLQNQTRGRGGNASKTRSKLQVYNVCWSSDNTKVITIQSVPTQVKVIKGGKMVDAPPASRLKVWDSMNGDLLRVISNISDGPCAGLVPHPLDSTIVITSGEDGLVNIWDIDQESNLSSIKITNDDGTPSMIGDTTISQDGTYIAITDCVGRVTLIGLDDPDRFSNVLSEQYFSSDYAPMSHDDRGFAIDAGTQLPVHESPAGILCRMDHTAYFSQPNLFYLPTVLSTNEVKLNIEKILQLKVASPAELDRVFSIFRENFTRNRIPKKYKSNKTNNTSLQRPKFQTPGLVNRNTILSPGEFSNDFSSHDSDNDSDFEEDDIPMNNNNNNNRRSRRPIYETRRRAVNNNSSNDNLRRSGRSRYEPFSYSDDMAYDLEGQGHSSQAIDSRNRRAKNREKAKRARIIDDDDDNSGSDIDESDEENDFISLDDSDDNRKSRKQRRTNNSDSDNSGRPKRNKTKKTLKKKSVILVVDDDDDDDDDEDLMEEISPEKPKKQKVPKLKWTDKSIPIDLEIDRKWLQVDSVNDQQYVPQMGDRIIYFSQGHKEMLHFFAENSSPPWQAFPQRNCLVECDIIDISYEFPTYTEYNMCPSVIAIVKLLITRVPSRITLNPNGQISVDLTTLRATRNSSNNEAAFTVKLRKFNLPDFLIPSHLFQRALRIPWYEGMKIQTKYQDLGENGENIETISNGRVVKISNKDLDWPQSPWECLEVVFDDQINRDPSLSVTSERLCPWEVLPLFDESSNYSNIWNTFPKPEIPDEKYEKIRQAMEELMVEDSPFKPFFEEVDSAEFPDYGCFVHVPIFLSLIYRRVCNKYYRQIEALENDIHTLYKNCEYYNYEGSVIVINAMDLREKLLSFTRDENNDNMFLSDFGNNNNSSNRLKKRKHESIESPPLSPNGKDNILRIKIKNRNDNSLVNLSESRNDNDQNDTDQFVEESKSILKINLRHNRDSITNQNRNSVRSNRQQSVNYEEEDEDIDEEEEGDDDDDSDVSNRKSNRKHSKQSNRKVKINTRTSRSSVRQSVDDDVDSDNKYNNRNEYQKVEKRIDPQIRKDILKILSFLDEIDENTDFFSYPITDDIAPGYSLLFERPMDRSTLRANYESRLYTSVESIVNDVLIMYSNCEAYNEPDSEIYQECLRQKYCFRSFMTKDLNYTLPEEEPTIRRSSRASKSLSNYSDSPIPDKESKNTREKKRNSKSNGEEYKQNKQIRNNSQNSNNSYVEDNNTMKKGINRLDPELKRQMMQIVSFADQVDSETNFFSDPIDLNDAPGYLDVIEKPLDLSTIRSNIAGRIYSNIEEVITDINLMYDNCINYNDPKSAIVKEAKRQKKVFGSNLVKMT